MKANDFLQQALTAMQERAKLRDTTSDKGNEQERSMAATVKAFNEVRGKDLNEEDGWAFMVLLKLVRSTKGQFHADDYVDGAAYFGLLGEAAEKERGTKKVDLEEKGIGTFFGVAIEATPHWNYFQTALLYNTHSVTPCYVQTNTIYNHYLSWTEHSPILKRTRLSIGNIEEILKRRVFPRVSHTIDGNGQYLWKVILLPIKGLANVSDQNSTE